MLNTHVFLRFTFALFLLAFVNPAWAQNRSPVDPGAMMQQDFLRYTQPDFYNPSPMRQGNRFKPGKLDPVIITREDIKVKAKFITNPPPTQMDAVTPFDMTKPTATPTTLSPSSSSSGSVSPITQERFLPWKFEALQPGTKR
jgi:hypothetical protein